MSGRGVTADDLLHCLKAEVKPTQRKEETKRQNKKGRERGREIRKHTVSHAHTHTNTSRVGQQGEHGVFTVKNDIHRSGQGWQSLANSD